MRYVRILFFLAAMVLVGMGLTIAYRYGDFLSQPAASPGEEKIFIIEPGQSFEKLCVNLQSQGLISDPLFFKILAWQNGDRGKVKAGEFSLNTGWTPGKILDVITTTTGIKHRLVVPEGLTLRQIALEVVSVGLGSAESFERAARDPELLAKYEIPAKSAEGFLFPETYFFTKRPGDDPRYVVEAMLKEFRRQLATLFPENPPRGKQLLDLVTLASIVEKETAVPEERGKIAGVFANRLGKGMLLQTDPTVIFGLGEAYDGNLKRIHLDDAKNPYNTYQRPGLPPGPICSPGLRSLSAAANPEPHNLYYFVAKGDGSHYFSRTLDEHNSAVARYQLHRNSNGRGETAR